MQEARAVVEFLTANIRGTVLTLVFSQIGDVIMSNKEAQNRSCDRTRCHGGDGAGDGRLQGFGQGKFFIVMSHHYHDSAFFCTCAPLCLRANCFYISS